MNSRELACATLTVAVLVGCGGGGNRTRDAGWPDVLVWADVPAYSDRMADVTDAATTEAGGDQRLPIDQSETEELRALCLATGGTVVTIPCCSGTAPFPTSCPYLNRCGCAPEYLVPKEICECPASACFELWPRVGCQ